MTAARGDLVSRLETALARPVTGKGSSDFDLLAGALPRPSTPLREAAVLLAIDPEREDLILTRRAAMLRNHPGQIALPGGRREATDLSLASTALREAEEEVGLPRAAVRVLGLLDLHETVSGFKIQPVVGVLEQPVTLRADPSEVAEIFRVPLGLLLDPSQYRLERRRIGPKEAQYFVVPHGPYYIWGATARILRSLALKDL